MPDRVSDNKIPVMTIDRVPRQFCEGPFWGNGRMGAVMYVEDGQLCISVDHVGLWELRETLPDVPRAGFQDILQHKEAYLAGDACFVAPTDIFAEQIGRTKLPALALRLELPSPVAEFAAETDLEKAKTDLQIKLADGRSLCGSVWLDSLKNIFYVELEMEGVENIQVRGLGWDLNSPRLQVLKRWGYEPCTETKNGKNFTVRQTFGGDRCALLCGRIENGHACEMTGCGGTHLPKKDIRVRIAVGIETCPIGEAAEKEKIRQEEALVDAYLTRTESFLEHHMKDWAAYWDGFAIQIPNERLQEAFYQEMYKLYCNEREDAVPVTLQGVWNPAHRMPAWYGDLHNDLNVEACYWPAYKTGNYRMVRPYIDYYAAAMPRLMERAKKLFGLDDAIHVPTMMTPDGTGAASEWCYWNTILGPELFVAVDFTWFYEYSREQDTLEKKIYPFVEKVIHLYQGIAYPKEDGYLHIPFTTSPEVDRDGCMLMADDATFTLSSLHYLCRKMAGYAVLLGKDGAAFMDWDRKLAPVKTDASGYPLFAGIDVFHSHRHFCQMFPVFPLCEAAHNETANRALDTAVKQGFLEYAAFSFPYIGIMAARCGRGNMCRTMLEIYCMAFRSRNSFTVNGDPYQNGVLRISASSAGESADAFTLESGFFVPTLLCEMFAHRAGDSIWLTMGLPEEWKSASIRGIAVEGGHRIAVEVQNYHLVRARIDAGCEETVTIRWKKENRLLRLSCGGKTAASGSVSLDGSCVLLLRQGEVWELEFAQMDEKESGSAAACNCLM